MSGRVAPPSVPRPSASQPESQLPSTQALPCGNSSLAKLEGLVKMFQKAEVALRMDVEARKTAEKASFSDLI